MAILTYKRPQMLQLAVKGVLEDLSGVAMDAEVIVVDNDPERSAEASVVDAADPRVIYVAEPSIGIAAARNAALDAAAGRRLLVFIDDDEVPIAGWLKTLVGAWESWECDAVAGPTMRVLESPVDEWVRVSEFFEHRPRPNGMQIEGAASGNLLLDLASVRRVGVRFDPRFGTTGGEDTMFCRTMTARGAVIRWCEDAVTTEPVARERATRSWVLKRERRIGNTWSRVHIALVESRLDRCSARLRLVRIAMQLLGMGAARFAAGVACRELGRRARGERDAARGVGVLLGLMGSRIEEYRRQ